MPKQDYIRRTDVRQSNATGSPSQNIISLRGNADMVDGLHASSIPRANTLLALDPNGKFPPSALPQTSYDGAQATGHHGVQYFGPTTFLAKKLRETDTVMVTLARVFDGDESIILSHYTTPQEYAWLLGTPERIGEYWHYPIARAKRGTEAQEFPQWAEVISMGSPDAGGHILLASADSTGPTHVLPDDITDTPYIQMRQNNLDYSTTWKLQLGKLSTIPDRIKDTFPDIDDWDRFGLAVEDVFAIGGIYALYGAIAGDLDVSGTLTVKSPDHNAKMEIGNTAAGWGQTLRDSSGVPVIIMTAPYQDAETESDVAFVLQTPEGEKPFFWRYDADTGTWKLTAGGFDFSETAISWNDFVINPRERKIEFTDSMYIFGAGSSFGFVGAVSADFYGANIETSGYVYSGGGARVGNFLDLRYAHGTSTKDPTTDAPDTWLEIEKYGVAYYVPAYAAS